jgi:uncharacterized protein (DUF2062 family)/2-polyprenyl-3-methyl-5-hydroxy-6-metoxy-1,4-benzoquinol methylase
VQARIRRLFYGLRTEGVGPVREATAIGVGIFIGCLPVYGFHLLLVWTIGWLLRLNRLKMYLAANISNPLVAPTLVFAELQLGAWLRRGSWHALTVETATTTALSVFGLDVLAGSLVIGGTVGTVMALATYAMSRSPADDAAFASLVRETSDRYIMASVTAWEFARGKLRGDPIYRAAVCDGLLPSGGTIVDVGCGQGLMLALLADAIKRVRAGAWPRAWKAPPCFERAIGIELRRRTAAIARQALQSDAEIVEADIRTMVPAPCRVVLFFDVLHMMPTADQEAVIAAAVSMLEPGGVMLVREADAAGGWRHACVRLGNRLKALAFGAWRQRFFFRTADEWIACFGRHGVAVEVRPMTSGAFSNVLLRITKSG